MKLTDIENKFLNLLKSDLALDLEIQRNEYGILRISLESQCDDIGKLTAYIKDEEITLSCKISHVHCDVNDMKRQGKIDPVEAMIEEGVAKFVDLVQERAFLSKTIAPNGQVICTGWGPIKAINDKNEAFDKVLEQQYGKPVITENWLWSGKINEKL